MNENFTMLKNAICNEDNIKEYRAIPFWSWNNELDEKYLVKQIEEMKEVGIGGFIMHARTGLKDEYLGEKWFDCIGACLKKAKELGMSAWVYDENGWPSGFVGGKLLENEEYRARFLEYQVKDYFDESAECVFEKTENGFERIYSAKDNIKEYHCVYIRVSPANSDILKAEVVDEFIRLTHEEYYKRFKDSFGKELVGFFTDEPQYYRWATPYTPAMDGIFFERYGEKVRDYLVYLFVSDARGYEFRYRYFCLLNEMYVNVYYKKLYDWCEAHNCKLTGHSVEEGGLVCQMLGGAAVMPTYECEHIPAIDALARVCGNDLAPKQVGSVASQLGKKQVLTETFGCSGNDATPKELKAIAEWQYFNGVNLMCQHLLPISVAAQGKVDHPPVFSKHSNWWEDSKEFYDHFAKLGYIIANTTETYDIGIIHPMRSIYLDYQRDLYYDSVKELEDSFNKLISDLRANGVRYQLIDETILAKYGRNEGDKLIVGNSSYDKIIVPDMKCIASHTLELLSGYHGKLLCLGKIECVDGKKKEVGLKSNVTWDDILNDRGIKFRCDDGKTFITSRKGELGEFIFVLNKSLTESSEIEFENVANSFASLDLQSLKLDAINDKTTLKKCESLILVKTDKVAPELERSSEIEDITSSFKVTGITENFLVLDCASYSFDGVKYSDNQPIPRLFEELLRMDYKGKVYIKQGFTVKDKVPATFIIEKGRFEFIKVNGRELSLKDNDFDIFFGEADISDKLVVGENEIVYCVNYYQHEGVHFALFDPLATESLRNCLYYDTHIENTYIKGNFRVDADMNICAPEQIGITSEMYKNGYPFFKGTMTVSGEYYYDGVGKRILSLDDGRFLVADALINGKRESLVLATEKDITDLLVRGNNKIEIKLNSSLRNLLGPHHFKSDSDPLGVSPYCFNFRGCWGDKIPKDYTPEYKLVPFGLNSIKLKIIK